MKAPIVEIFSSFQGEGLLIGKRQIFIRFAGCNLSCNYCDTPESQKSSYGTILSVEDVMNKINHLKTPDLHSISFTGGEPLLYTDFINEIIEKTDFNILLETNGTLPDKIKKLKKIDFVSLDFKVPEHFDNKYNNEIIENEIKTLKILIEGNSNIYCKLVVLPSTKLSIIEKIAKRIVNEVNTSVSLVIQPVSPIDQWQNNINKLFEFTQIAGKYLDVLMIPQTHKFLKIN
ncbi:MAG: 7-carboxy-7-deazaguanine synthase QueE [Methanobacteriaceae archaeon]|nr:7-carboxy-7-deazaguanine synthase QueE [Candidatus Methanorudis spinitermitis]